MTVALDASGGDNPEANIIGATLAVSELDVNVILVGDTKTIENGLKDYDDERISIVHAPEVITPNEKPTTAVRRKKNSSLAVGLRLVRDGMADAFVSSGSTGALLTGATFIIGRAEGVERPALGVTIPNASGQTFLIDCGANVDATPLFLLGFAKMGADYVARINKKKPTVGLINIGTEPEKGNALAKEAFSLLSQYKDGAFEFVGNIEARDIPLGAADVAVCDAFVGNVILKHTEGMAKGLMEILRKELTSDLRSKIGAGLAKPAFRRMRAKLDYDAIGGAPFLGLKRLVVKAHGSSNAKAILGAIRQCCIFGGAV